MTRFNDKLTRAIAVSPIKATTRTRTYEGGEAFLRDEKSELFLLAVVNFYGQNTFYEKATNRDNRYASLIHKVALVDPQWVVQMLTWLRGPEGNIRTAAIVGAAEFVKARKNVQKATDKGLNRQVIRNVLQRADEPGELLAYWTSRYGRRIPKPIKRGVADAVKRLYNEYTLLKYDTSKGWRFGDVIEMCRVAAIDEKQNDLFRYAIERRQKRNNPIPESLEMVRANRALRQNDNPEVWLDQNALRVAGMTWEDALSAVGSKVDKGKLWEAIAPSLGYMALLRNIRNMDEAGVSDDVVDGLLKKISDPIQVAKSRQFPFRFYSAHRAAPSQRWGYALDKALTLCMSNLPEFKGRTLILVDTSGSMSGTNYSENSSVRYVDNAALFGVALALRNPGADLRGFASGEFDHKVTKGGSVLKEMEKFTRRIGEVGHGTDIQGAVKRSLARGIKYDRIVILTDMQTFGGYSWNGSVTDAAPKSIPMYGFNLAGYKSTAIESGTANRHEMGGVTDATFKMIPLLEASLTCTWPWV
jgi:hypothetical protein